MKNKLVKKGVAPLALIDPIQEALTIVSNTVVNIKKENAITERFEIEAKAYIEKERETTKRIIHESNVSLAKFCVECETKLKLASLDIEKLKVEIEIAAKQSNDTHEEKMAYLALQDKTLDKKIEIIKTFSEIMKGLNSFDEKREILKQIQDLVLSLS